MKKKEFVLTVEAQKQIEDFYNKSNRYIWLLCYNYQQLPLITKEDIYSLVYEKLCVYASTHNIEKLGYQKLAECIVRSAALLLMTTNYAKKEFILNDSEQTNNILESTTPDFNNGDTIIERKENEKLLEKLFDAVSDKERFFIEEFYFNDKSLTEIAKENGISPQLTRYYIQAGIKKMNKLWKQLF